VKSCCLGSHKLRGTAELFDRLILESLLQKVSPDWGNNAAACCASPLGRGATGGGIVAPVWRDFMQQALQDEPVEQFRSPSEFVRP
ncbi:MAG: hypothetical protein AAF773_14725, partial [Cyanobacteria bacterium P01_D01_bin.115]